MQQQQQQHIAKVIRIKVNFVVELYERLYV